MLSIIYSLLESSEPTVALKMFLPLYTWGSGVYDSIPEYAILDFVLGFWTLFHLFVALSFVSISDAIYKKPLLQLHRAIVKPLHDVPMLVPTATLALTIITANLSWRAYHHPEEIGTSLRAMVSMYTWVCAIILQKLSNSLVKMGVDYALKVEQEVERHDIKKWTPPGKWTSQIFAPIMWLLRPEIHGEENIPTDHPGLYVMNHSLNGLEMAPFVSTIYLKKDIFLRGLADNIHFGHLVGEFIRFFGGVRGTRDNVDALMENKDNVLVYPGGGHEIMKPCSVPNYTLMWKQRVGFARVAIRHGYPIVPCACVGTEDMQDRLFDINLQFVKKDLKAPVVAILPHKLQRCYFWFGEPIPTTQYNGDYQNDEFAKELRDKVKAAVEAGIKEMQERQANDPNRFLFSYLANSTKETVTAFVDFCKDPFAASNTSAPVTTPAKVVKQHEEEEEEEEEEEVESSESSDEVVPERQVSGVSSCSERDEEVWEKVLATGTPIKKNEEPPVPAAKKLD